MAIPVEMPKLGNTVEECILAQWKKRKGEKVAAGEILADIETDKATFELAAPAAGVLLETFFGEGTLVPVYTNIAVIGEAGENAEPFRPAAQAATAPAAPQTSAAPTPRRAEAPAAPQATAPTPRRAEAPAVPVTAAPTEVFLSPRARRFVERHPMVSLPASGSGPGGRILEQDLRKWYRESPRLSGLAREKLAEGYEARGMGSGINGMILARDLGEPPVRMSTLRERIARRMRESLASTAQYTLHSSAEATALLSLRAKIKAARGRQDVADVNLNEMVMFATVKALLSMPEVNAELIEGKLYRRAEIHLGFACDTDKGLLAPVIKDCGKLSLAELAQRTKELTARAQAGTLGPDDLTGATFTVSNLGNLGIEAFTPIVNPPQVAILGVDCIELKPVRRDGRVEFVEHIGLSLTCDHQVIDGAPGARFLKVVKEQIEKLESLADLKL